MFISIHVFSFCFQLLFIIVDILGWVLFGLGWVFSRLVVLFGLGFVLVLVLLLGCFFVGLGFLLG